MPIYIQIEQRVTIHISLNPHQYYMFSFFKKSLLFWEANELPKRFYRRVVGNKIREMGCWEIIKRGKSWNLNWSRSVGKLKGSNSCWPPATYFLHFFPSRQLSHSVLSKNLSSLFLYQNTSPLPPLLIFPLANLSFLFWFNLATSVSFPLLEACPAEPQRVCALLAGSLEEGRRWMNQSSLGITKCTEQTDQSTSPEVSEGNTSRTRKVSPPAQSSIFILTLSHILSD